MTIPTTGPHPARVLLIGMMGSGKSTIGTLLASRLGARYIDNDSLLQARTGREAVQIIGRDGPAALRSAETATLDAALAMTGHSRRRVDAVIGVAAGSILDPAARAEMQTAGFVVWLRARPETLVRRVLDGPGRDDAGLRRRAADMPAWLAEQATDRAPFYAEAASLVVDVDDRTPAAIAQTILEALRMPACGWLPGPFAAVVLDLDGLLVETETIWLAAKQRLFAARGIDFAMEDHRAVFGASEEYTAQVFARRFGLGPEAEPAIRDDYHEIVTGLFKQGVSVRPGGRELVAALHGSVPFGLASNTRRVLVDLILDLAGLAGSFDSIVSGDDGAPKPQPDLYRISCARLGVEPRASVAVEDSPTGVAAARAAGLACIAIPSDPSIGPDGADSVFASLADLIAPVPHSVAGHATMRHANN